jgi:hypothetical protein
VSQPLSATVARIVQGVWVAAAAVGASFIGAGVASQWDPSNTICHVAAKCSNDQLNESAIRTLSQHGISLDAYVIFTTVALLATVVIFYAMGGLIIWRKPRDRGAILTAFFLIAFPPLLTTSLSLTFAPLILLGLLFPDGRFAPTWTRWMAVAAVMACMVGPFFSGVADLASLLLILPIPILQIYRFRSLSSWTQRQQTKWALFGLAAFISGFVAIFASFIIAPWQTGNGSLYSGLSLAAFPFLLSAIPISLAISVLRSRLWDIDRVISRALAYTTLSLILAGIYIGGVIGFQRLFQVFAGGGSPIAIALSTLVIAALFGPLRHRIQVTIDRRFYRAKYDGTRAVAAFAHRLRDEVDLAQLSRDMTYVVRDTLQPEHVSLWLRDDAAELATPTPPGRSR